MQELARQLDQAYHRAAEAIAASTEVRVEKRKGGGDRLCVTPLDKLDEPPSLLELRRQVDALMPRVDLPEAILEVQAWTGFADEFRHVSERRIQVEDLPLSACAVLIAEACNINLEPVVRNEIRALSYARLAVLSAGERRNLPL